MIAFNLVYLASIVQSAGVAVHLELVDRIIPLLPERIAKHREFIRAGAFYPDSFYNCGGQYDVAEDAHWPPFLGKGVEIVHERKEKGIETGELEAFLVGILSHQVSDVSWHSLGIFQGLLQAMADSEFDGDYDKAHGVLDIGGDMIQLSLRTDKRTKDTKWKYNVEDIEELTRRAGYPNIPRSSIHYCMARGQAAYTGELKVADVAYKRFSRRSPMMFNELETYFIGGLMDMHEQIEECLPELVKWIKDGFDVSNYWEICPVFAGRKRQEDEDRNRHNHTHTNTMTMFEDTLEDVFVDEISSRKDLSDSQKLLKRALGGDFIMEILYDSIPEVKKKLTGANGIINGGNALVQTKTLDCKVVSVPERSLSSPSSTTVAEMSHPLFGGNVMFWQQENIVVSAASENTVYVYDKNANLKYSIKSPHNSKEWGNLSAHFGSVTATFSDDYLLVSSPGISTVDIYDNNGEWTGGIFWPLATQMYGYTGFKMIGTTLAVAPDSTKVYVGTPLSDYNCTVEQSGIVYAIPGDIVSEAISSKGYIDVGLDDYVLCSGIIPYQQVGKALFASERQLLVGSPGTEEVWGFDHNNGERILKLQNDKSTSNEIKPSGFGGHFLADTGKYVLVGAPAGSVKDSSYNANSQEGMLVIYSDAGKRIIGGQNEFEWFGIQGCVVGDSVYMSSPHAKNGNGMLWKLNLDNENVEELGTPPESFASGFGSSISSNGERIVIGMPYMNQAGSTRQGAIAVTIFN